MAPGRRTLDRSPESPISSLVQPLLPPKFCEGKKGGNGKIPSDVQKLRGIGRKLRGGFFPFFPSLFCLLFAPVQICPSCWFKMY